jgi:hypothetical protein
MKDKTKESVNERNAVLIFITWGLIDLFVGVVIVLYLDCSVNIAKKYGMIERDPRKMVIVDHARPEGKRFRKNFLGVSEWSGDKSDKSLYKLRMRLVRAAAEQSG